VPLPETPNRGVDAPASGPAGSPLAAPAPAVPAAGPPAAAAASATDPPELRPLAGRYTLLGELGRGGMAVVYRAREVGGAERDVAIKVVSRRYAGDDEAVRRFEREARTVAGLDHPNIVGTLAIEPLADDAVAIVTHYVPGVTLRGALREAGGPLDFSRVTAVLRDLAGALAYAHARRIVHRDVKPENVFLEAGTGRALLADFGIARPLDVDSPLTVDGAALGTPTYMAPEQITGRGVDERTDVYALGLVGWEMLAGRRPWQGETLYAVLHRQQHDELPDIALLRPDIPAYLLAAVRGALAKQPSGRWRDGAEFLARLTPAPVALPAVPDATEHETLRADQTMRVTPPQGVAVGAGGRGATGAATEPARWRDVPPRRAPRPPGRRGRWVTAAAAAVAALALAGAALARRQADDARRADDAAVTGVTDAQLDSLLRAAAAAAPLPGRGDPRPAARRPLPTGPPVQAPAGSGRRAPAPPPRPTSDGARRGAGTAWASRDGPAPAGAARPADVAAADPPAPEGPVTDGPPAAATPTGPTAAGATAAGATAAGAPSVATRAALGVADDARCASPASADQRACLMTALDRFDVPLTRDYQALIAVLRRRAGGAREPASVAALRAEQRAWLDARDRQCRTALAGREGPLWGAARAPCFAALSDRRAAELRARTARVARDGVDTAP
jgi:uncharacterized protein YecT (DUF1311 family)